MFEDLPASNPHRNKQKLKAIAATAAFQAALVVSLIVVQMAMPEKLGDFRLLQTLYMAPPPPPPPAPALSPAPESARRLAQKPIIREVPAVVQKPQAVQEKPVVTPTPIPADVARILESGSRSPTPGIPGGAPGGVRGGIPGAVSGGLLGGVLGGAAMADVPPPPAGPVRVGGNVKQPKLLHIEQPQYPPAARRARIEGVVMVEATVTADGSVEKVKALSGPPMLMEAASNAVSKWKYEPTYLNGEAVPVVLTARITFSLRNSEK